MWAEKSPSGGKSSLKKKLWEVALRGQKFMKKVNFGPKSRPRYSHAVVVPFRSPQASLLNQRQNARRHMNEQM